MTTPHIVEVVAAASVAGATTAGVTTGLDLSGVWSLVVPVGVSAIVGYFSAAATTKRDIGVIVEREGNHFKETMRRLDSIEDKLDRRSRSHREADAQAALDDLP